ncbi:MAG: hypothetical protein HYZ49_00415 [Chloroflexi bacterium]|nr:hypothetical protein [Chloroflexota bacterium]
MRHLTVSRRQVKQFAVFVHRLVSLLIILALVLQSTSVVAQAALALPTDTATPDPLATALPTDIVSTAVASDIPSETPTETPPVTETPTATAKPPTETPTALPTDIPSPTATPFSKLRAGTEIVTAGGILASTDGNVSIAFPAGAAVEPITVNYQPLAQPPLDAKGNQKAIFAFEVTAQIANGPNQGQAVTKFTEMLDFTINLSPLGLRPGEVDGRTIRFGYFNEQTQLWEPVPFALDSADGALKIKARVDHFSIFGVSRDFNPGWSLLYSDPQVDTFTGAATYNYPIAVPPGPDGLQPNLSLAYNNQQLAGLQAWYQSDWVGHGWSLNTIEIVRDLGPNTANGPITGNSNGSLADCTDRFTLLFNGTGYKLLAATAGATSGVYYTQQQSNLYIKRINDTAAPNQIKQYWLIKDENGTEYRLGYNADSEQITHSNCTDANESRLLNYSGPLCQDTKRAWAKVQFVPLREIGWIPSSS